LNGLAEITIEPIYIKEKLASIIALEIKQNDYGPSNGLISTNLLNYGETSVLYYPIAAHEKRTKTPTTSCQ
jgi:hypothetical protein